MPCGHCLVWLPYARLVDLETCRGRCAAWPACGHLGSWRPVGASPCRLTYVPCQQALEGKAGSGGEKPFQR